MAKISEALAFHLKRLRDEKRISQEGLAQKIDTHRNSIIRYESGDGGISIETLSRLASALEVEETDLVIDEKNYNLIKTLRAAFIDPMLKEWSDKKVKAVKSPEGHIQQNMQITPEIRTHEGHSVPLGLVFEKILSLSPQLQNRILEQLGIQPDALKQAKDPKKAD